jgi:hypothetical protein
MNPSDQTSNSGSGRLSLGFFFLLHLVFAGAVAWWLWVLIPAAKHSFEASYGNQPAPQITELFFDHRRHVLFLPLPWLAVALFAVIRAKRVAGYHLALYSASLILFTVLLALVAATAFVIPWLPVKHNVVTQVFGSGDNVTALINATEITAERLHKKSSGSYWELAGYDRGSSATLDPIQVQRLQQILLDESSYAWRIETLCAPTFGVVFTSRSKENESVQIAVCFRCGQIGVFNGADGKGKRMNEKDELGGFARPALLALTKQLLPDDAEIQALK